MLTILCGRAKAGKTSALYRRVSEGAREGRRQLIIVPETRSHDHERRLLLECGNRAGQVAAVTTFTKLSREILRQAGKSTAVLDGGGRVLVMYRAVQNARLSLRYFRGELRPELLGRLLSASDELKASMIDPAELLRLSGALPDKLHDIAAIYACYCALCQSGGLDGKDLITQAAEALGETDFLQGADLYIDDFAGMTRQEYALLERLLRRARSGTAALLLGEDEKLFAEQYKTLGRLQRLAGAAGVGCETIRLVHPAHSVPELAFLERSLFAFGAAPFQGECPALRLFDAPDVQSECELAAALMRQKLLNGARAREIAVVCGGPDEYAEKLENACARFGVPIFVSRQQDILKKPAFLGALGGPRALLDGMRADSVLTWLKAGLTGLARTEREKLESYLLLWNLSGRRWESDWTLSPGGFSGRTEEDGAQLCELNALRRRVWEPLQELEKEWEACRTGGDFTAALLRYWERTALEERLNERVGALTAADRRREAAEYAQLYNILREALEQFAFVVGGQEMDERQFFGLLELMLSQYDVGVIPISLDCAIMGDFERLSLSGVRHLFVLGARDGLLPPSPPSETLLSEPERILLEGVGIELTQTAEERAFETQSAVYHAFASASESITILCPGTGSDGGECRESYLVRRIRSLLPALSACQGDQALLLLSLTAPEPAYELACRAAGGGGGAPGAFALESFLKDERRAEKIARLRRYAQAPRGPVAKPENIRALYGEKVRMTASRVERAESCRFSYFMQYGLRARPASAARFGAPEIGTMVHYVIENAVRDLCEGTFARPAQAAGHWTARYVEEVLGGETDKTARFRGLIRALSRHAASIVENVWEEICASDFVPLQFEMSFGAGGGLPPLEWNAGAVTLEVGGKIDRVDGYIKDGRLYLKVVDYKTGSKSFHLSDVLYGLNMQMFLYLLMLEKGASSTLLRLAGRRLGQTADSIEVGGALYVPARDPFVAAAQGEDADALRERLDKARRRIGIVSGDEGVLDALEHAQDGRFRFLPVARGKQGGLSALSSVASAEQFGRLLRRVEATLSGLADRLADGDIEATPHRTNKGRSVCDFCDYRAACHFDENNKRDSLRYYPRLRDSEVHALLEEEEHAGAVHTTAEKGD